MKIRIGAGTIIAVLLALLVGGYFIYQQRKAARQPPIIERQIQGVTHGIAPVPEFALRQAEALRLTPVQREKIQHLATAYRADIAPTKKQLDAEADRYQKYLESAAKANKSIKRKDMEQNSEEIQRLSGIISTTRHSYWQKVLSVLTPEQQQAATKLVGDAKRTDLQ